MVLRTLKKRSRWAKLRVPSHGPDNTDYNTPRRRGDQKTFVYLKPSNLNQSLPTKQGPTTIDTNASRGLALVGPGSG